MISTAQSTGPNMLATTKSCWAAARSFSSLGLVILVLEEVLEVLLVLAEDLGVVDVVGFVDVVDGFEVVMVDFG